MTRIGNWDVANNQYKDLKLLPNLPLSQGVIPVDTTGSGLDDQGKVWTLDSPVFQNAQGELLVAVAGQGTSVLGLFSNSQSFTWRTLAEVPNDIATAGPPGDTGVHPVTALGSFDGNLIVAGLSNGKLLRLDQPNFNPVEIPFAPNTDSIVAVQVATPDLVFAATDNAVIKVKGNTVTRSSTGMMGPVSLLSLAVDRDAIPVQPYVASDLNLWTSGDEGETWFEFTQGLPRAPHCKEIRVVKDVSGVRFLYLATFGWSIFRTPLNTDVVERTVLVQGKMDIVDRVAFGHDEWAHPTFFNILHMGTLHPLEEIKLKETDGSEITVDLKLNLTWKTDFSVTCGANSNLDGGDESDSSNGSVVTALGQSQTLVLDLATDELWPDRAHIEVKISPL
jgi:hypothetical protein